MSKLSNIWTYLIFLSIVFTNSLVYSEVEDLCIVNGCSCTPNALLVDLIDVDCQCQNGQSLSLGPAESSGQVSLPPELTGQLKISSCQQVEIFSKTLNAMPRLQNITISGLDRLILHSRLYEARVGNGQTTNLSNIDIENVQDLQVKRHTFEGVRIGEKFMLNTVIVQRTPSLAFAFDYVNQFSIFRSRFDRVSMWGFKLDECNEFNALGETRFYSLASQALHMKCNKFWLAFNIFDNLQDSSLSVTYGLADIQGNTFEKLTGKPFIDFRPITEIEEFVNPEAPLGLIFRENKFACDPKLPFNAMAMPSFDRLNSPGASVNVENNHFLCQCDKTSWFIAAMTHNFDRDVIANGRGSLQFLQNLWDTAGNCLKCGLRQCDVTNERFHDFARSALIVHKNELKCSSSGQALKSHNPKNNGSKYFGAKGEEESLADTRNMELLNGSSNLHNSSQCLLTLIFVALLAIKVTV